jgi:membrane protein
LLLEGVSVGVKYFGPLKRQPVHRVSFTLDLRLLLNAIIKTLRPHKDRPKGHKRLYASSLAFKTILALVPALAIFMAVLSGEAFTEKREVFLDRIVDLIYPIESAQTDPTLDPKESKLLQDLNQNGKQEIRASVNKFAGHARKVGFTGLAVFAVVVFLLFRDVEDSFNYLWGIGKGRRIVHQAFRHLVLFITAPIAAVLWLTVKGWFHGWALNNAVWDGWFFTVGVPFFFLWVGCTLMYALVPNMKVQARAALWAGFVVAFLLEVARRGMNFYTVHVLEKSHVYGALWVFPVILIWFYVSWTIILFGAEVAYYLQDPTGEAMEGRR